MTEYEYGLRVKGRVYRYENLDTARKMQKVYMDPSRATVVRSALVWERVPND